MTLSTLYTDPRLTALYDALNPAGPDTAFYRRLAQGSARIADLGCGTGLLACALAEDGHRVTGIDPSAAMLKIARARPHADDVTWIEGDAGALAFLERMDLVLLTGHVAQIFLDDTAFLAMLRAVRRGLRAGGRLVFDSRHPAARAWETWTRDESLRRIEAAGAEAWHEGVETLPDGRVRFDTHYRFESTGEEIVAESALRFRDQAALAELLAQAGFASVEWFGDWDGSAVCETSRELIAVAG